MITAGVVVYWYRHKHWTLLFYVRLAYCVNSMSSALKW